MLASVASQSLLDFKMKGGSSGLSTLEEYLEHSLYGTNGFNAKGVSAGRRTGDFPAIPEAGPLFGEIVAGLMDEVWKDLGQP